MSKLRNIIREAIRELYNTSAEYPGNWDSKPSEKFSDNSFPSIGEQETDVKYDPVFGNFQGLDGKVNFDQLQSGIDNEDPEAIEVIRKIQSSPKYSKNLTKTRMGKPVDFSKEYKMQELGIDGSVQKKNWKRPYYYDCKHNLFKKSDGTFQIYLEWTKKYSGKPGWFHTSSSNRIYHVSVKNNTSIFYDLKEMRQRIREQRDLGHVAVSIRKFKESYIMIEHDDPAFSDLLRFQY